jgi:hypothetical protein
MASQGYRWTVANFNKKEISRINAKLEIDMKDEISWQAP